MMLNLYAPATAQTFRYAPEIEPQPEEPGGEWWWALPDVLWMGQVRDCAKPRSRIEAIYAALDMRVTGCPAVLRFGNKNNPTYSDPVPLNEACQRLSSDLMSYSEFGRAFDDLIKSERDIIGNAHRNVFGDRLWGCNHSGYNGEPYADFVNGIDTDKKPPAYDAVRGFATNSYKGELVDNMVLIHSFDWYNIPTSYGIEILDHPAVQWCTIQYGGGSVGGFGYLSKGVPVPLISKAPVYYWAGRMERYYGARRPAYWRNDE